MEGISNVEKKSIQTHVQHIINLVVLPSSHIQNSYCFFFVFYSTTINTWTGNFYWLFFLAAFRRAEEWCGYISFLMAMRRRNICAISNCVSLWRLTGDKKEHKLEIFTLGDTRPIIHFHCGDCMYLQRIKWLVESEIHCTMLQTFIIRLMGAYRFAEQKQPNERANEETILHAEKW